MVEGIERFLGECFRLCDVAEPLCGIYRYIVDALVHVFAYISVVLKAPGGYDLHYASWY